MERPTTCTEEEDEFVLQADDGASQLLVFAIAKVRGLKAFVPGRSRRRVAIRARKEVADSVVSEVRRLVNQLHLMQVKAVGQVLEENGISVSPERASLFAKAEAKAAETTGGSKPKAPR